MDDWYALDFVRTLAEAAGLDVSTNDVDQDGVNLTLRLTHQVVPLIDVLVRGWTDEQRQDDQYVIELTEPEFNRLAGRAFTAPPFLFVWRVPPDLCPDVPIDVDDVETRDLGIYASLADEPRIAHPDPARRRSVRVPLANVLTGETLRALVEAA